MSIDARIVGIREVDSQVKLTLVDRPGGGPAGQNTLVIDNAPYDWKNSPMVQLIGCDVWGGANDIYLGDTCLARRDGYTRLLLVKGWEKIVTEHTRTGG